MGSTYFSLHYHIVYSTKERSRFISDEWSVRLHEYLGGTINGLGGQSLQAGGIEDHVHLLVGLRATHCLADVVREVKKASSKWVHEEIGLAKFAWQEGYSAFTVSPTARPPVKKYIENQREHHRKQTYLEELVELLNLAEIEYDPRFLE